jgi:hypothetical protein
MRSKLFRYFRSSGAVMSCLGVLAYLLACDAVVQAQSKVSEKEWAVAINFAGRQRMLSQKMTKEFLLISLKVNEDANKKLFNDTSTMFNDTLNRLIKGDAELNVPAPPSKEIADQLNVVNGLWTAFKAKVDSGIQSNTNSQETLAEVAKLNVALLQEMNKAVGLYQSDSQKAGVKTLGAVINVAGRQRMLTQKMSKEILLIALGVDPAANQKALQETKELFQTSLAGLVQGNTELGLPPTTSKPLLTQLRKVESLWKEFSPLVDEASGTAQISPTLVQRVAELNPPLLREMNRAVTLYEAESQ